MDDDDRDSNASSENEQDEIMEDAEDIENENEPEEDENENENEKENEEEAEEEDEPEAEERGPSSQRSQAKEGEGAKAAAATAATAAARTSASPRRHSATPLPTPRLRPTVRPEALTARLYDIVPTMAAPQSTSINALAVTPDQRYWMTGGSDCYIRKYYGPDTINGKQLLTVAQRHPFVDSVVKAGVLLSYWENEEPSPPNARGVEDHVLSPVYSLAVHSQALWLLSGTDAGSINLQSVRHDEGKRITTLQRHSNAVSVLQLAPNEKSVLSGSWDKNIFDWDLDNGQIKRGFEGTGGQISAIELRPASGAPIPQDAHDEPMGGTDTLSSSNANPLPNGVMVNGINGGSHGGPGGPAHGDDGMADAPGSPDHDSLFGSPSESLFGGGGGENDAGGGGNPFGDDNDNDNDFSQAMEMTLHSDGPQDGIGSMDMSTTTTLSAEGGPAPAVQPLAATATSVRSGGAGAPMTNGTGAGHSHPNALTSAAMAPSASRDRLAGASSQQAQPPPTPALVFSSQPGPTHFDPTQSSDTTFFSAAMDGTIRIWDRRVSNPVARIGNRPGVPPWCMGACWSPDGNWIYAGRRNGTVEEFNIHKARSRWTPERVLKFPQGSGPVSAVRAMVNGRHLVCASHDIMRLYDLHDASAFKHSSVPFLIIPGPPKAGVISNLYIDPTSRFMISTAGTRGWEGTSTEVLIGYEIGLVQ